VKLEMITGKAYRSISFISCQLFRVLYPRKCFGVCNFIFVE